MVNSQALARTLRDVVLDVFLFPVWWYSRGLFRMMTWVVETIQSSASSLSLKVWLQNLFVPMYGQHDWQSRIISVFMRTVQIVFRLFVLLLSALFAFGVFVAYLIVPVVLFFMLFYHGFGGMTLSYGN